MKVIVPKTVSPGMIVLNQFLDQNSLWNPQITYSEGAIVDFTDSDGYSKVYESLANNNLDIPNDPQTVNWLYLGYSNSVGMFDQTTSRGSTKVLNTNQSVSIKLNITSSIDSLCILNSTYRGVNVILKDNSGVERYRFEYAPIESINNWPGYVSYDPFKENKVIVLTDIPLLTGELEIVFLSSSIDSTFEIKVGELIIGNYVDLGITQRGINAGITDYSVKETDSFGNTIFVERSFSKRFSCNVLFKNKEFNKNMKTLYSIRAKPVVWIATDSEDTDEATVIYGYYKNFSAELTYPDYSVYNLEVEGLL